MNESFQTLPLSSSDSCPDSSPEDDGIVRAPERRRYPIRRAMLDRARSRFRPLVFFSPSRCRSAAGSLNHKYATEQGAAPSAPAPVISEAPTVDAADAAAAVASNDDVPAARRSVISFTALVNPISSGSTGSRNGSQKSRDFIVTLSSSGDDDIRDDNGKNEELNCHEADGRGGEAVCETVDESDDDEDEDRERDSGQLDCKRDSREEETKKLDRDHPEAEHADPSESSDDVEDWNNSVVLVKQDYRKLHGERKREDDEDIFDHLGLHSVVRVHHNGMTYFLNMLRVIDASERQQFYVLDNGNPRAEPDNLPEVAFEHEGQEYRYHRSPFPHVIDHLMEWTLFGTQKDEASSRVVRRLYFLVASPRL